jgi:glycine/D-amino acid oxidase-like deaminating enzyme
MIALRLAAADLASQALLVDGIQIVGRANGEIWVGGTSRYTETRAQLTPEALRTLRRRIQEVIPAASGAATLRAWAGLRPCSTLRRPIIARIPRHRNVILASGHHRSGVLLAPITARLVREMILELAPTIPLAPFSYRRH